MTATNTFQMLVDAIGPITDEPLDHCTLPGTESTPLNFAPLNLSAIPFGLFEATSETMFDEKIHSVIMAHDTTVILSIISSLQVCEKAWNSFRQ